MLEAACGPGQDGHSLPRGRPGTSRVDSVWCPQASNPLPAPREISCTQAQVQQKGRPCPCLHKLCQFTVPTVMSSLLAGSVPDCNKAHNTAAAQVPHPKCRHVCVCVPRHRALGGAMSASFSTNTQHWQQPAASRSGARHQAPPSILASSFHPVISHLAGSFRTIRGPAPIQAPPVSPIPTNPTPGKPNSLESIQHCRGQPN